MTMVVLKRFMGACTVASLGLAGCVQPSPPLPPLPALPQTCTFTSTPDIVVPANQGVRISVGRRRIEASLVSIAVSVDKQLRQDGSMYVPGPDTILHSYQINNPIYFVANKNNDEAKHYTASMLWSLDGITYDHAPAFSVLCLWVNGATVAFYTARTSEPNTIVKFDFYPPLPQRKKERSPAVEQPAS